MSATRASTFDFPGTASRLALPLPSLQYLFLTTSGYISERKGSSVSDPLEVNEQWRGGRAWRIADPTGMESAHDGERVLVDLHEDVAGTIMRNEELVLSELDKVCAFLRTACRIMLRWLFWRLDTVPPE